MIVNRQNLSKCPLIVAFIYAMLAFGAQTGVAKSADVPSCFANPPSIAADGSYSVSQPSGACGELGKDTSGNDSKGRRLDPRRGPQRDSGPQRRRLRIQLVCLTVPRLTTLSTNSSSGQDELVRFAAEETRACAGSWWTTLQSVTSTNGQFVNAADLEARLALPQSSIPRVVAYSSGVAVGTLGYFGIVAPAFGRSGGAVQFWFPSAPVFTKEFRSLQNP